MFQTNRSCYDLTHKYVEYCNRMFSLSVCSPTDAKVAATNTNRESSQFHNVFTELKLLAAIQVPQGVQKLGLCRLDFIGFVLWTVQVKQFNAQGIDLSHVSSVDVLDCLLNFLPHPQTLLAHTCMHTFPSDQILHCERWRLTQIQQ
jgi:hypothetical protein